MPGLVIQKGGEAQGRFLPLEGGRVTVGRGPDNDLCLDDRTVSRYHAVLTGGEEGWRLRDLGSHNGTFVNGRQVVSGELADGDRLRLGSVELVFAADGGRGGARAATEEPPAGEITRTMHASRLERLVSGAPGEPTSEVDRRLGHLLALTELTVTVGGLEALFEGVARVVRRALRADRVVPLIEEADGRLRPYLPAEGRFGDGVESCKLKGGLVPKCRTDGVAACWLAADEALSAAAAPIRLGRRNLGVLYCERSAPSPSFSQPDLTYLFAVAMQTGLGIENVRARERMARQARSLSRRLGERYDMIGDSEPMRAVYRFIRKVAPTNAGVLVCGESGTGKEMVARALHRHSRRGDGPLEIVNCAAVPPALLESQLFGHVRGAFTGAEADRPGCFELADGGTLFLDEVVDLAVGCQAKLLRALEEGSVRRVGETRQRQVDVRVIAATNRDPQRAMAEGRLREDLFYRLDRLRVVVPPLRERVEDIPLLAQHFLAEFRTSLRRSAEAISAEALEVFAAYGWPGNVRELRNVVERMVLLGEGPALGLEHVPADLIEAVRRGPRDRVEPLSVVERRHIRHALEACDGNKSRAAELLGIDRSTLYARLRRYDGADEVAG
jgi:DNA-binding NtrC family response regulator